MTASYSASLLAVLNSSRRELLNSSLSGVMSKTLALPFFFVDEPSMYMTYFLSIFASSIPGMFVNSARKFVRTWPLIAVLETNSRSN